MNWKHYALILCVAGACFVSGCKKAPYEAERVSDVEAKLPVLIMDKACKKAVAISNERASWTPDSRLITEVTLVNQTKDTYRVQVQTSFKDADGFEVQATNWELILIPPSGMTSYKATALNTKAEKYNVRIRTAQ